MERLQGRYRCPNGDEWEIWLVTYQNDRYAAGGNDEVTQYKRNGREVGHMTRHLDASGKLVRENVHGTTILPNDCKAI